MVERLQFTTKLSPYYITWFNSIEKVNIIEQCYFLSPLESFIKKILCNVIDMDVCHLLLRRPWQFDLNTIHKERDKMYKFYKNNMKIDLAPIKCGRHLADKPKSLITRDNLFL